MKQQNNISPEKYVKTRARTLPVAECYLSKNWQEYGLAEIVVARKHGTGNITFGVYLVDTFALGVKQTFYNFNVAPSKFEEMIEKMKLNRESDNEEFEKTDYVTVHNIIFGAIAFAEEYGYKPHKDFSITKYILEEDDDKTELIEFEFGKDGRPFLIL